MITLLRPDPVTSIAWATPTSGFGHLADELALPYIRRKGASLTPMFGGEESQAGCTAITAGLPYGQMTSAWPRAQRVFNWPRRQVNLYWRNLFKTRTRGDPNFLFLHQLKYASQPGGFAGSCPMLSFTRQFTIADGEVRVQDTIKFHRSLRFDWFVPVCVALFPEWHVGGQTLPTLHCEPSITLHPDGVQRSAAGTARLWIETMEHVRFNAGDCLERRYYYRWSTSS